jgi:hypothetical protein
MQVIMSELEYNILKSEANEFYRIVNECSKDGIFYAKELEKHTRTIARFMKYDKPNFVGWYHNCTVNLEEYKPEEGK